jgi:tetratricopeptide (TPR) repeat protein
MTEDSDATNKSEKRPQKPPALIPPDAVEAKAPTASRGFPRLIVGCGLLLVIAALWVVFLPLQQDSSVVAEQMEQPEVRSAVAQSPAAQVTPNDDFAQEIDRLMAVWLQQQAEAEAVNIVVWGGDSYAAATSLAKECDRLLGERQYLPAKNSCEAALDQLVSLMASRETRLDQAITAGLLAIEQGHPGAASGYFQQALAINADDEKAANGARRAEQLPAVLRFMQDGLALEQAENLQGALLAFTAATKLDPDFARAQQAQSRVHAAVTDQEFQQAMSRALQAMADGKLSAAGSALQQAESIKPGDRAVRDLKQQLSRNRRTGRLSSLRQDAQRFEQEERWPEALKTCKEALSLDSQAAFAANCQERVTSRIDLDSQLKSIFSKPERLFTDGPLRAARQLLDRASAVTPRGPLLTAQIDQLDKLITQAEAQIEVVIMSDGLTDVVIYHVGRLGLFLEKSLVLRTGDYTATGSRDGFKDVRQTLKVRPGAGRMVFKLRCEEPI